jgi:hypothetical protein
MAINHTPIEKPTGDGNPTAGAINSRDQQSRSTVAINSRDQQSRFSHD